MIDSQSFANLFPNLPPELITFIAGMVPIFELRGAIPLAIGYFHLSIASAFFWAVSGNIVIVFLLDIILEWLIRFVSEKFSWGEKFFNWLFHRTHRKTHKQIEKYGLWGLFLLVAIPLPMTGGWTGVLAAFLFNIERKKALPVIAGGIVTAGLIVTVLTAGFIH